MTTIIKNLNYRGKQKDFQEALNKAFEQNNQRENKFLTKKSFAPSTVGYGHGNCPRYWVLAFKGANFEYDEDAQGVSNMNFGTYYHQKFEELLSTMDIAPQNETEIVHDDPPIRGFIDSIVHWQDAEVLIEFKTTRQESFVVKQAKMKESPNHRIQILIYMKLKGIKDGYIIYENKNTQEKLVIPIEMNEENTKFIDSVFTWMREVRKTFKDEKLPTRPFRKNSKICKNCPVQNDCWSSAPDGDITLEVLETK